MHLKNLWPAPSVAGKLEQSGWSLPTFPAESEVSWGARGRCEPESASEQALPALPSVQPVGDAAAFPRDQRNATRSLLLQPCRAVVSGRWAARGRCLLPYLLLRSSGRGRRTELPQQNSQHEFNHLVDERPWSGPYNQRRDSKLSQAFRVRERNSSTHRLLVYLLQRI
ncbi:hypothetical protein NDU88_005881 [Pleurodeles waltl]|uniref:Uncharacterized protein n=1 Tax=Pleurodeles waltl TaxID=8319 RepID=A0AAV7N0N5_PLEWA|nr:hypothetical protein NDU88_005881 [Pleurodeles waltl]